MSHRTSRVYRWLEIPALYERFQRLLGAHAARRRFVAEYLRPAAAMRLLDIGCGTGSLLDYLPGDVAYSGYDLNASYIDAARRRYGARGEFHHARVGEEPAALQPASFDVVVAKGILHHLTDAEAHQLLRAAFRYLRPGGSFVSLDPVRHAGQNAAARMIIALDRGGAVRDPAGYERLVREYSTAIEGTLLTDLLPIPYSHFVVRARK